VHVQHDRDAGLVRAVGTGALTANIVNSLIGAGIFTAPAALAASVGAYAPFAFLICAVAMGAIGVCFAEGGSRVPTSGGAYGYIDEAFGSFVSFVAGTLLWLSDLLACGGLAAAVADVAVSVAPSVAASVHSVAIVGVVGAASVSAAHFAPTTAVDRAGLGRALILALFALSGTEGAVSASGEVSDPARTIPRAIATALMSVAVLYIGLQVVAQGILGDALARSSTPLADAMGQVHPGLRVLLLGGAGVSMLGWLASDILSSPRILFAFARDGMMPPVLGRLHPWTHTPYVAIGTYALLAIVLALTGTFAELAVLSTLAVAPLYVTACLAAWRLSRRGVARAGTPLNFAWLGPAAVVGIISMIAVVSLASRTEVLGLIAVTSLTALAYVVRGWVSGTPVRTSPARSDREQT
jgi:amino acid transporter